jgi:hypothetical protein
VSGGRGGAPSTPSALSALSVLSIPSTPSSPITDHKSSRPFVSSSPTPHAYPLPRMRDLRSNPLLDPTKRGRSPGMQPGAKSTSRPYSRLLTTRAEHPRSHRPDAQAGRSRRPLFGSRVEFVRDSRDEWGVLCFL